MVRGGGGMRDQAFAVTQIVGDLDQLERVLEAERARLAALHRDRHQRAWSAHLLPRKLVLRMTFQARIEDARHLVVALEEVRNLDGRAALPIDTQIERLKAFEQKPGIE